MKTNITVASADYRKLSDDELVHRFIHRNDHTTINVLFERYGHLTLGVCLKYLKNEHAAKEATQQIFIRLSEDMHTFQRNNFKMSLLKITRNFCLAQLGSPVKISISNEFSHSDFVENKSGGRETEHGNFYKKLNAALYQLHAEERVCIDLFYVQKMTYAEIAATTKYSLRQVKTYLQNGKHNLKIKLETLAEERK